MEVGRCVREQKVSLSHQTQMTGMTKKIMMMKRETKKKRRRAGEVETSANLWTSRIFFHQVQFALALSMLSTCRLKETY